MNKRRKALLINIAIPLAAGAAAAFLSREAMLLFDSIRKPPLSPPGWVFPVVWTLLYLLMGIASYIVTTADIPHRDKKRALAVYAAQLIFNFVWPILFFRYRLFTPAFAWLAALWVLIFITVLRFDRISSAAGNLLVPYLVWVAYAGYLNLAISILN